MLGALVVASLLAAGPVPAAAEHSQVVNGHKARWAGSTVVVRDAMVSDLDQRLARYWRKLRGRVLRAYAGAGIAFDVARTDPDLCLPASRMATVRARAPVGVALLCRTWPSQPPWAAIEANGAGQIERAMAYILPNYQGAFCHELGHMLGLGHRTEAAESCMVAIRFPLPDAHDIAELSAY